MLRKTRQLFHIKIFGLPVTENLRTTTLNNKYKKDKGICALVAQPG
jgi:hypothetical protein